MAKIIFLGAVDSPFSYNRSLEYSSDEVKKNINFGVRTEFVCLTDVAGLVFVKFYLLVKYGDKEKILDYNVSLSFRVEDKNICGLSDAELRADADVKKMVEIAIGFMRGTLFFQEKNTPIEGLNLPILSVREILPNMKIQKYSKRK